MTDDTREPSIPLAALTAARVATITNTGELPNAPVWSGTSRPGSVS